MVVEPRPKLTYEDYVHFPDDGLRYELIEGEVFVNPAPNIRHQDVVGRLFYAFTSFLQEHGGGRVFVAPCDVLLSEYNVVEPDIVFVSDADSRIITDANIRGVPTLLIEVLSAPALDRGRKLELYGRFGVPEYWIVDPVEDRVEVYRSGPDAYGEPEDYSTEDSLTTPILPGVVVDLRAILKR